MAFDGGRGAGGGAASRGPLRRHLAERVLEAREFFEEVVKRLLADVDLEDGDCHLVWPLFHERMALAELVDRNVVPAVLLEEGLEIFVGAFVEDGGDYSVFVSVEPAFVHVGNEAA